MNVSLEKVTHLKRSYATLQLGVAKADGRLTLTDHILHFETLNKHLELGNYAIRRDAIANIEMCSAKTAGIPQLSEAGIKITTEDNHSVQFILAEPDAWLQSLQSKN